MLRIEKIILREVKLPLKEPFTISSGSIAHRRIFLVQLFDASGTSGWGECVAGEAPNYSPETIDTAWLAIREWIAPRILGHGFDGPERIYPFLEQDFRGHNMAKAGVEMAAWELVAQIQRLPLAKLLGGVRQKIPVGISLGIQASPEALIEKARVAFRDGYRKVKIKITPGADIAYLDAVRAALGPKAALMADANNAYSLDDLDTLVQLDAFGLMMIEQPLAWDDLLRHAELQRRLRTPICLDESITSLDRAEDMVTLGSGKIINIKPGRVGGFGAAIAIHNYCQAKGVPVWCGGMLESGIGRAHNVALASLPNFSLPGDLSPSARYWEKDLVSPEWTMDNTGMITVPWDQIGMGVTVDIDRVDNLTVRQETLF